jgi:uncharacterized repeat protein (TIGR02543 family)
MKKLILGITAIVFSFVFFSCPDDSGNEDPDIPVNPVEKTIIVFDNTYGICTVMVYNDYRRRETNKIVEIPAGRTSDELEWMPSASMPFYFAYRITLKGVSGFAVDFVPEVGKDQKAVRIDANTRTVVPIPVLDEAVSSEQQVLSPKSYLSISNNSNYSFQLYNGVSMIRPDNFPDSGVVNSGERAPYTINTGRSSDFRLLVGADYKPFPDTPERFEAGNFYSYQYNNSVSLDTQIPITLDNMNMPMYSVSFSANGGSGTVPASQTVRLASVITLPLGSGLTNGDKVFGGWGVDASSSGIVYSAGTTYTVTRDITLYAKWYPAGALYTVTFNSAGGKAAASQSMVSGALAVRPPDPYRAGYTFTGWYRDAGGQNYYDFETPVTASFTLYAAWDANKYTVTFNANGADGTAPAAVTVDYGSSITLPGAGGLSKPDETFRGWNTEDDGTETAYASGAQYTVNADVTLFAMWGTEKQPPVNLIEMVWVQGGSFEMGKELNPGSGYSDVTPVHTITLTGFYMGKYEVTQAQYQSVMGSQPSQYYGIGDNYPVYNVSWYDALVFCNKLSIAEGLSPAYRISGSTDPAAWGSVPTSSNSTWNAVEVVSGSTGYRLPTEAQWEYTAKGGNGSPGNYTYSGSNTAGDVAWYSDNNSPRGSKPVGTKAPNGLGIYDMSGNVWEWCWDWYGSYSSGAQTDPMGASSGSSRVGRGGNWYNSAEGVRSAYRYLSSPYDRSGYLTLGFRLARQDSTTAAAYTVTFAINGGTGTTPSAQTVNSGTAITLPSGSGLTRSGYNFDGWNTNADGTGTNYSAESSYTVTGNVTLYAKWEPVVSGTYTVTSGADSGPGTLRYAIENAADGSTITIQEGITIRLDTPLQIPSRKNLAIEGNSATLTRSIAWTWTGENDGYASALIEIVYHYGELNISRLHFKDGRSSHHAAAIDNYDATLTLESCIFSYNQTIFDGGAISNGGTLIVKSCTFYENRGGAAGAIYTYNGSLTLVGNLFYGNTSPSSGPVVYRSGGTVTSLGYNVVDLPFGTGTNQAGWPAVIGDKRITELPFSTTTFRLLPGSGAANVIATRPADYPTVDFYGNPIPASGAAAGAVQSQVSGSGYNLELSVNDASRGAVSTSPAPNQDGLVTGTVTLTANANTGYEFSYWLVDGEQSGSANPLPLTMSKHTKVQAVFGRVVLVTNFNDDMYSETTAGTLRNALANAQDWDIIRFSGVTPGTSTVALYDALPQITKSITIEGNGVTLTRDSAWTTIEDSSRLMYVSGTMVTISRIHFKNGRATIYGAAIYHNDGNLSMESCIFSDNQTSGIAYSGAIYNKAGSMSIKGCTFYRNSSGYMGGAISYTSTLILEGNLFYGNTATDNSPVVCRISGTVISNGYNVVDVPYGTEAYTGSNRAGWEAAPTDTTFADLNITGDPINTATFAPVSALNSIIPNPPPEGFPATDFYGNARTFPGAPGAVK